MIKRDKRVRRLAHGVILIHLLVTACRGAPTPLNTPAPHPTTPPAPTASLAFMFSGDATELAAYQQLVTAFTQAHPEIQIELLHVPGEADYQRRLAADFAAGTPADVLLLDYRRYVGYAATGNLEVLEPYLAPSPIIQAEDFYAEALAPFYWKNKLTCLPREASSLVVYYNIDLFAAAHQPEPAANWTRDEFLRTALALTRDMDGDGNIDQYGLGLEPTLINAAPFIWQEKGEVVDNVFRPLALGLESPEATRALHWFINLQLEHHVAPDAAAETAESSLSRFTSGRTAMLLETRRIVSTFRASANFRWEVAPLPKFKGRRANVLLAEGYCLAAASKQKAAAWAFIEFASSPTGQTLRAFTGRDVPSLKAVAESPAFLDSTTLPTHDHVWLDAIPSARPVPVLKYWDDIERLTGEELRRAFYGQAPLTDAIQTAILRTEDYFKLK